MSMCTPRWCFHPIVPVIEQCITSRDRRNRLWKDRGWSRNSSNAMLVGCIYEPMQRTPEQRSVKWRSTTRTYPQPSKYRTLLAISSASLGRTHPRSMITLNRGLRVPSPHLFKAHAITTSYMPLYIYQHSPSTVGMPSSG